MQNAGEIKAQLGVANMAMAEAIQAAGVANEKIDEARTILASLIGATQVPLGLVACAAASENVLAGIAQLQAGVEQNTEYMGGL